MLTKPNPKAFSLYHGVFTCQRCKEDVTQARFWYDTKDITWMCSNKHISKVNLSVKKGY